MVTDTLQDELRQLFAKAKIPSSPALAARILELADDPDATVDQFADLIQMDPALAARLLRMTNSTACAQRQEVTTIQRAVSLLGINRVRTVSLGFQLVGHLGRLGGCPFDMKQFWRHSLLRACMAREFAETLALSCADEAFLIGLLQDCGTLLLVQLLGKPYADLHQNQNLSPAALFEAENRNYRYNHAEATAALAREWNLPQVIVTNVEQHHTEPPPTPSPTEADRLRSITYLAGSVPLRAIQSAGSAEPALAQCTRLHLNLDAAAVQSALTKAAKTYAEMAGVLQGAVPDDLDVTDLLSQANQHLTVSVESERRHFSQEQAQLESALGQYREQATRDPLTGILNRGALTDAIRESVQQGQQQCKAVTVLFLDLDNFKRLNDTFGHQVGDDVLRGVALTLQACIPNAGTVGRYGGEEFVLLVPGLNEPDAAKFAESVIDAVRRTPLPGLELPAPVTCSLGAVWGVPTSDMTAESYVKCADDLMYQAKRSGKDRCCFRAVGDVYNVDLLESDSDTVHACAAAVIDSAVQSGDKNILPEEYERVAKMLDHSTPQRFATLRKSERKQLFTPCRVAAVVGSTLEFEFLEGYVRNISIGGIAVLTPQPMLRGQPIEITILIKDTPLLFVAGVVAFCRHAKGVIHDVGVQLFANSKQPILSDDPISAIRNLDWVAHAMKSTKPCAPVTV